MNTEETFVLASLKEFVKIWCSGNQASFNLECRNGNAYLKMKTHLGPPAQQHYVPPHLPHGNGRVQHPFNVGGYHQPRKQKSPGKICRNNARAAAHKAKQNVAAAVTENIEVSDADTLAQTTEVLVSENSEQNEQISPPLNSTFPVVPLDPSSPSPCE